MVISMPELSVAPIRTAAEKAAKVIRELNISCDTIAAYIVDCSSAQLPVTDISAELKRMNDTLEEIAKQATIEIKDTELIAHPRHVRDNYDQRRQRLMATGTGSVAILAKTILFFPHIVMKGRDCWN